MTNRIAPQFWERDPLITVIGGYGTRIQTKEYGELFDATSGYWSNILGMRHPELMETKQYYGGIPYHLFGDKTNSWAEELAQKLCSLTGLVQAIFGTTGSDACENARKEVVLYHKAKGFSEEQLVFATIKGSYHGSFGAMLKWTNHARNDVIVDSPYGKTRSELQNVIKKFELAIERAEKKGMNVAAFFYEPVMGARGVVELPFYYLNAIAEICRTKDILLVDDEVATGFGRTGKFFAYEHVGITPDVLCLAKGISAGYYPLSATLVGEKIINAWNDLLLGGERFNKVHQRGNTIAGTPEAATLALKVIEIIERDKLVDEVERKGQYALQKLQHLIEFPSVRGVRGKGLFMAVDVRDSTLAKTIKKEFLTQGINMIPEGRMVMFCPAYIVTVQEIDFFVESLEGILKKV